MERHCEELFLKIQGPCSHTATPHQKIHLVTYLHGPVVDVIGLVNTVFCEKTVQTPDNDGRTFSRALCAAEPPRPDH